MARVVNAEDVLDATFAQTQFREGYDEREVDDFLDGVVVALRQYANGAPTPITRPPASPGSRLLSFLRGDSG